MVCLNWYRHPHPIPFLLSYPHSLVLMRKMKAACTHLCLSMSALETTPDQKQQCGPACSVRRCWQLRFSFCGWEGVLGGTAGCGGEHVLIVAFPG